MVCNDCRADYWELSPSGGHPALVQVEIELELNSNWIRIEILIDMYRYIYINRPVYEYMCIDTYRYRHVYVHICIYTSLPNWRRVMAVEQMDFWEIPLG